MMYAYDIETICNIFTATFVNVESKETHQFVICKWRDDTKALITFLERPGITLIGFNNLDFDFPVLKCLWRSLPKTPAGIASYIYREAQKLIEERKEDWQLKKVEKTNNPYIPQIDLYKLNHWDRNERHASLKWVAINMGFENIQDMPIPHNVQVEQSQIPLVLEYNLNDVMVTLALYDKCKSMITMRKALSEKYQKDLTNYPDSNMGKHIVLKMLSDKMKVPIATLKKCRTPRNSVRISDCILPEISFKSKEFQSILDTFNSMVWTPGVKPGELVTVYDNVEYYFGLGGIHGCRSSGTFKNIHSADVTGYYPALAVVYGFAPEHFKNEFPEILKQISVERKQYAKGTPENYGLKIAQNGSIGNFQSEFSPFYDPKAFLQVTINGQLLLAMLCERITTMKIGRILMANTDGIEAEIWDEVRYKALCEKWEQKFNLKLEHNFYKSLVTRDINNYIAIDKNNEVKTKGAFDVLIDKMEYHKDYSQQIVPIAVKEYLVNGTPIVDTINNCQDVGLFMLGSRARTGKFLAKTRTSSETLPKHIRYYITNKGVALMKQLESGDNCEHKGYLITLANKLPDNLVDVNRQYYIREANKMLNSVVNQTSLF